MPVCKTCKKYFQSGGIARHRAMHRDKKEDCVIELADGIYEHKYSVCKHKNKDIEIDEKRFFCKDCNKWINCEDLK